MASSLLVPVALFAFFVALALCSECNTNNPQPQPPNKFPVLDGMSNMNLLQKNKNGLLYSVTVPNGGNTSTFYVSHVWGSPYQMGFAQGQMYEAAGLGVTAFIDSVWTYYLNQIEQIGFLKTLPPWLADWIADFGFEAALEMTEVATYEWTGSYYWEELQGIADASGMSDQQFRQYKWIHMLPGLTEGKCSMFGAWGSALDPSGTTKLLQLRALDWDMDGPFRNFPAIVVYHPNSDNGHPFVNIGVGGFVGGLTGVSKTQLGISEIGVDYPDSTFGSESRIGVPFVFLLRDILQFDNTYLDALARIVKTKRTCDLILGVGDGKATQFRGVAYSSSKVTIMDDTNQLPLNNTWHPRIPNVVYWGMDWVCPGDNLILSQQIKANYGKISAPVALSQLTSVEGSGSNHLAYYDLTNMLIYVSFAANHTELGNPNGYAPQFTSFDANALMNVPPPSF